MEAAAPVKVVVDTTASDAPLKTIKGDIKNVSRNYIEVDRSTSQDEKSQYKTEMARVIVPINRIVEVVYYQFE